MFQRALKKFCNVEKLLDLSVKIDCYDNAQLAKRNLNFILFLKNIIRYIPELHEVLKFTTSTTFERINQVSEKKNIIYVEI